MDAELVVGPDQETILTLLSVADLKSEIRVLQSNEDSVIQSEIVDAYEYFDGPFGWLRRAVLPQQWLYYRDSFHSAYVRGRHRPEYGSILHPYAHSAAPIEIPLPPLRTVDEVAYRDDTGVWNVVDPSVYEVVTGTLFGQVVLAFGQCWPLLTRRPRAVRIKFSAGWQSADRVPSGIVRGIKLLAGTLYNNREATYDGSRMRNVSLKLEYGIDALAGKYRIPNDLIVAF